MTALSAYWDQGRATIPPQQACLSMLQGQQLYGQNPSRTIVSGPAALGLRLFPTLPEDRFDAGPVSDPSGRWTMVADVRLDDREGVGEMLGIDSKMAVRTSDSALVMRAVERWELDAFERLIGEFAIILMDNLRHRLILARDFLGQRPLHFHRGVGFLAAASMPKGLHALAEVPREPDEESLANFLAIYPDNLTRQSYFKGVERVLAGEMLVIDQHTVGSRNVWAFQAPAATLNRAEASEAVRETLDRAVRSRLRGAGDLVGTQLSGGLDSTIVTASAAALAPERQFVAFTSAPKEGYSAFHHYGRFIDESPLAASVAALYPNVEHVVLRTSGLSPLSHLDRDFFLYERPVLNCCNMVWVQGILSEAKARGIKVLLTGVMGNFTVSYPGTEALAERLASGRWIRLIRDVRALRKHGTRLRSLGVAALFPFLPHWAWRGIHRAAGRAIGLAELTVLERSRAAHLVKKARVDGVDFQYKPRRSDVVARMRDLRRLDVANYQKGDLAGWGIDVRDPTADRRLIELCLSIPPEHNLIGGTDRAIARNAFVDRLPTEVAAESRKGYQAADWHEAFQADAGGCLAEIERIASVPTAASVFDIERMRSLAKHIPEASDYELANDPVYRLAMLRGISAGHFLRKSTGVNS